MTETEQKVWDRALRGLRRADMSRDAERIEATVTPGQKREGVVVAIFSVRCRMSMLRQAGQNVTRYRALLEMLREARATVPVLRVRKRKVVAVPERWAGRLVTGKTIRRRRELALEKRKERRRQLRRDAAFDMRSQLEV